MIFAWKNNCGESGYLQMRAAGGPIFIGNHAEYRKKWRGTYEEMIYQMFRIYASEAWLWIGDSVLFLFGETVFSIYGEDEDNT